MLSAIVLTSWPEEADYIEACFQSVSWADEIIVVENHAPAKTLEIARRFKSKIFSDDSHSFAQFRNLGKDKAKGDWLLYIDGDERVSLKLKEEILSTIKNPQASAYNLRRVNFFLGKEVRYGDRYPDYIARLFKKSDLSDWTGQLHESLHVKGELGTLEGPHYHLTHGNIKTMLEKPHNFTDHEAQLRLQANHPPVVWWRLIRVFLTEFYNRIIKMQEFRQGAEGWIDGIFQSFSLFIAYARLWELQRKPTLKETYQEIDKKIQRGEI